MSRRARAAGFAGLALVCAAIAAALAHEYQTDLGAQLGELRPVVVADAQVGRTEPLRPRDVRDLLAVRRVPLRFAPADALADPVEALGMTPRGPIPAGAYVTAAHLRAPHAPTPDSPAATPGTDREAVEVSVTGAAVVAAGRDPVGARFDVVATSELAAGGRGGRTRVIARRVRLLDLREARGPGGSSELSTGASSGWIATLAASRGEALRLIEAHNFAREVRLIGAARN